MAIYDGSATHLVALPHSPAALRLERVAAHDQRAIDPHVRRIVHTLLVDEDALCGLDLGCDGEVGVVELEVVEFVGCEGCPEGGGWLGGEWLELEWRHGRCAEETSASGCCEF